MTQLEDEEKAVHGAGSEVRRALGIARVQLAGAARAAHAREQGPTPRR